MEACGLPTWREAWTGALYGPDGFFRRERPRDHFRTSVHASPLFAQALLRLARERGLDRVVDLGSGGGELLAQLHAAAPGELALLGVDVAPRPAGLPSQIGWSDELPERVEGLLVANEWLDNIACEVVETDGSGTARVVHVDPATGAERLGDPCTDPWLQRWWPLDGPGLRAEVGSSRDAAWDDVVRRVRQGLALAVDYGHTAATRPAHGSLASYRDGWRVDVLPDGSRDVTADVAVDSLTGTRMSQRDALRRLGVSGRRPPPEQAHADPAGYLRSLGEASEAAELTARTGLGDFWWVLADRA